MNGGSNPIESQLCVCIAAHLKDRDLGIERLRLGDHIFLVFFRHREPEVKFGNFFRMILQHIPRRLALEKRYRKPVLGFMLPMKRFRIYDLLENRSSPRFLITKQAARDEVQRVVVKRRPLFMVLDSSK